MIILNWSQISFTIIANAKEAKTLALKAIKLAKEEKHKDAFMIRKCWE
ncbi:PTS lactose/cellobiose transporter subunit IIA [Mesoplasma florum]|nr:PTS lactose/cellobiose transporter subunit IIA [Mesoplasma florum]